MKNSKNMHPHQGSGADLSVVIPHYNSPDSLANALASLAEQRDVRLEVLVIDDASDVSCAEVTQKFRRQGLDVTLHVMPQKTGTLGCRLKGMELATAPRLGFMDADDLLAGPDAYAEALAARSGEPDILHFITLSKNRWGLYSFDEYMAPIAEKPLTGEEVFSTWLDSGCKAHTVWNKFYSRRLYQAVAAAGHTIKIDRIEDFYLNAWFFLLARSYQPVPVPVYKYHPPRRGSLQKSAARALDCLRMYLELPAIFTAHGLPVEQAEKLREFLRLLVTLNGAKMCEYLMDGAEGGEPSRERLEQVLHFGTEEEVFLALAVANGSNANTLRDVAQILRFSW